MPLECRRSPGCGAAVHPPQKTAMALQQARQGLVPQAGDGTSISQGRARCGARGCQLTQLPLTAAERPWLRGWRSARHPGMAGTRSDREKTTGLGLWDSARRLRDPECEQAARGLFTGYPIAGCPEAAGEERPISSGSWRPGAS